MSNKAEVIENMSFEDYRALPQLNASKLKDFDVCPDYCNWRKDNPMKETEAFARGTMVHTWVLENSKFQNLYYPVPKINKASKEGKAAWKSYQLAAGSRTVWDEKEIQHYTQLAPRNDTANEITVLFWFNGVHCKARFDMLHRNPELPMGVEDLKTIADIDKIDRDFAKFKYYIQAGFYTQAYYEAFGEWPEFFKFNFISTGDYLAQVICEASFDYVEFGRMEASRLVTEYQECVDSGEWPKMQNFTIERPKWI
jgi:exodeoxyribonuclease VIII